jgi:2'-hydroxyisoflavone reductase
MSHGSIMRALVIGGTQFMGRALAQRLVDGGHDVSLLHRSAEHDLGPDVHNLQADRADLDRVGKLIGDEPFDVVFDFAYDWQNGTTAEQVESLARACHDGLQRYVFISSIGVYETGRELHEDAPLAPDDHPNPYIANKASTERALFAMHRDEGFPVTTFRPPFVHGPRQPFYREQFFWDRLRDGRPIILPGAGDTPMQWVYADDVARACLRAAETPEAVGEAFNVGHVEPTTHRTFVEALGRVAGVEPDFVPVPRPTIQEAGGHLYLEPLYFGEMLDLPPLASSVDKIARTLDFTPIVLEEGLRKGFAWYLEQPRREVDYSLEDRLIRAAR